jgi:hypothetical protein
MKYRAAQISIFATLAGLRLRCFLAESSLILIGLAACVAVPAQISVEKPYHLAHVRGVYVDAKGNPIPGAEVTLDQGGKAIYSTRTDGTGKFAIRHISGHYWLHVEEKGYAQVSRQVVVGLEAETYLHGSTLYMIAGPGACSDDCSKVFTNRGKFEQAIREYTARYDEATTR